MSRPLIILSTLVSVSVLLVGSLPAYGGSREHYGRAYATAGASARAAVSGPDELAGTGMLPTHGTVDFGCIGRSAYSTKVLQGNRSFVDALKSRPIASKNILCLMNNELAARSVG